MGIEFVKLCWPLELVMLLKSRSHTLLPFMLLLHQKYASTIISSRPTHICFTPTLGVNTKNIPFIHPLPFNKPPIVSCCYLPFHYPEKRFGCSPKEKKWKKIKKKMKNRPTQTLPKTSNKGRYVFKQQRIPLSPSPYIHTTPICHPLHSTSLYTTHMHILIWLYDLILWIHCLTLQYMFTSVYELSPHLWAPHKPLSYKVRERAPDYAYNKNTTNFERIEKADIMSALERIHKYHIWET